jgi:hypothetical protein
MLLETAGPWRQRCTIARVRAILRTSIGILAAWVAAATAIGAATTDQGSQPAATTVIHLSIGHPRQPFSGIRVSVTGQTVARATVVPRAWFFELADGSKCRALAAPGRVVEGEWELYTCKYGSAGEADAVLGDLDASAPLWTIRKVLINKKAEPQTIKSLAIASVRTVWQ